MATRGDEEGDPRMDLAREAKGGVGSWRYMYKECNYCGKSFAVGRERYSRHWTLQDKYMFVPREFCPRKCADMVSRSIKIADALGPDWEIYINHLKQVTQLGQDHNKQQKE